jgi:ABC-type Na+ efflux pump permease subunit
MDKFWLISRHAYLRQVRTKRFIFGLLSMPLFVLLMIGIGTIAVRLQLKSEPIGYVDHSGFLANPVSLPDQGSFFNPNLIIFPYSDETSADADLQTKKIHACMSLARIICKQASWKGWSWIVREGMPMHNLLSFYV